MRAIVFERPGDSSVLELRDVERPEPGPGEVRVKLAVSAVNPSDWKSRAKGTYGGFEDGYLIPHQDGAGTIDAVGEGVDSARVGERVWVHFAAWQRRFGTAAEWTAVPAERAVALPDGASLDLGATLGVPGLTAHRALFSDGPIDGATVLVAGGAGAVGHVAIQLAKWAGARVVATASTDEKAAIAADAGADAVVRYRDDDAAEQLAAAAPGGVDRVVEVALGANAALDLGALAHGAVIAAYSVDGGTEATLPLWPLLGNNAVLRFIMVYKTEPDVLREAVAGVSAAVAAGALKPLPLQRFPLAETAAAQDAVAAGAVGRVLVDVA